MKKIFVLILIALTSTYSFAQKFNSSNSLARKAIILYVQDGNGFYHKVENEPALFVDGIINSYAYDKKAQELYAQTTNGNYVITVDKENAKIYKKSKAIPQLKGAELSEAISKVNESLTSKFENLNIERQRHINDSIQKAKEDSIRKAKEDSINLAQKIKETNVYKANHKWIWVPIGSYIKCDICDKSYSNDSLLTFKISNDSIYWLTKETGYLDLDYSVLHAAKLTDKIKSNDKFKNHYEIYRDSLINGRFSYLNKDIIEIMNSDYFYNYMTDLQKQAPNGFFVDWSWDHEYSNITFSFTYLNTNKKTIKYIDVYWKVTNDVGDVRKTGNFKGTGPLEEWETASWNWDHSHYYAAGDASKMSITKVIITYMDGSSKVLSKNMIYFN